MHVACFLITTYRSHPETPGLSLLPQNAPLWAGTLAGLSSLQAPEEDRAQGQLGSDKGKRQCFRARLWAQPFMYTRLKANNPGYPRKWLYIKRGVICTLDPSRASSHGGPTHVWLRGFGALRASPH